MRVHLQVYSYLVVSTSSKRASRCLPTVLSSLHHGGDYTLLLFFSLIYSFCGHGPSVVRDITAIASILKNPLDFKKPVIQTFLARSKRPASPPCRVSATNG